MKYIYRRTAIIAVLAIVIVHGAMYLIRLDESNKQLTIGFLYVGDNCTAYTRNFIKAENEIKLVYGDKVKCIQKYNVSESMGEEYINELVDEGCDLIFVTSYGYEDAAKKIAKEHPEIVICQATGDNANTEPVLPNYHTFMGRIYEGKYITGVATGMKLNELIKDGTITEDEAVVGYVGAYPYPEVISGYTAYILGVRSVCESATMRVRYANSWSDYGVEKKCAEQLIEEGCIAISQHSDTIGAAVACEEARSNAKVFHVGYNWSMNDIAPMTSLVGCRINWSTYMLQAVDAVFNGEPIEAEVDGVVNGNDIAAGFDRDWVQMLALNKVIAAEGTEEKIDELIRGFQNHEIDVFKGDYIGVNPNNPADTINLSKGYEENEKSSAPSFNYILDGVVEVISNEE